MSTWRIQNILVIWWIGPKERTNKSEMPQSYQNSTKVSMFFCSYYKTQSNATKQEYHPSLYLLKLIKNWQAICCCPTRQVGSTKERTPNGRNPQCCNTQRIIRFQFILSRTNNAKKITQTRREPIGEPQFQEQEGAPQSQKPRNGEMLTRGGGGGGQSGFGRRAMEPNLALSPGGRGPRRRRPRMSPDLSGRGRGPPPAFAGRRYSYTLSLPRAQEANPRFLGVRQTAVRQQAMRSGSGLSILLSRFAGERDLELQILGVLGGRRGRKRGRLRSEKTRRRVCFLRGEQICTGLFYVGLFWLGQRPKSQGKYYCTLLSLLKIKWLFVRITT